MKFLSLGCCCEVSIIFRILNCQSIYQSPMDCSSSLSIADVTWLIDTDFKPLLHKEPSTAFHREVDEHQLCMEWSQFYFSHLNRDTYLPSIQRRVQRMLDILSSNEPIVFIRKQHASVPVLYSEIQLLYTTIQRKYPLLEFQLFFIQEKTSDEPVEKYHTTTQLLEPNLRYIEVYTTHEDAYSKFHICPCEPGQQGIAWWKKFMEDYVEKIDFNNNKE